MLLPLCRYGSAATALLLELLPVALTASTPLLLIVSTVTATPVDIKAPLILMIPADYFESASIKCFQRVSLTVIFYIH